MANDISGLPYILDTVTDSVSPTGAFHEVYAIRWTSGSLADAVSLQDAAGNVKWTAQGTIANAHDQTVFPDGKQLEFNGMKIATLGSGKVYVYAKRTR